MREVFVANDLVQLSFAEATLAGAGIAVTRQEPEELRAGETAKPLPGRLSVAEADFNEAAEILRTAFKGETIL